MSVIVDASVAAKWLLSEPDSERALALLGEWSEGRLDGLAPAILPAEVASTLWKRAIRGLIPVETAQLLFDKFSDLKFPLEPIEDSIATALELALRYRHPVYDCLYAALALRKRWDIVTADERFFNAFHSLMGRQVRLLRDWG